jgi:quinol monooxygenase YgiN
MMSVTGQGEEPPMSKPVTVVARVRAKMGKEDIVLQELLRMVEETRKEQGCINYDLHISADSPGSFLFYENWQSLAHLDRHAQSAHIQNFRARSTELLEEPTQVMLFEKVEK